MSRLWFFCFLPVLTLFAVDSRISAQSARIITLDHPVYPVLDRLQQRGLLDGLAPDRLPWDAADVRLALRQIDTLDLTRVEKVWYDQAVSALASKDEGVTAVVQPGIRAASFGEKEVVRTAYSGRGPMPSADVQVRFDAPSFAVQSGLRFDRYYDQDPVGMDVARRLYIRSEGGYVAWKSRFVSVSAGRIARNWSGFGLPGVVLTDNPVPFDHLAFTAGNAEWQVSSLLGELDMLGPDGTFTQRERYAAGGIRRFVAMNRLDYRPRSNISLSLFEGVLYSSPSAGWSLAYLNPAQVLVFEADNDPKNFENNLVFGAMTWVRHNRLTLRAQLLLDDGVYQDRSERRRSGQLEPSSYAAMLHVVQADLLPGFDLSVSAHRVSNLAYRTDQMEGQWSYAGRGLAANRSDFIRRKLEGTWHAFHLVPGLSLSAYSEQLLQGEGDLRQPLANDALDAGNPPAIRSGTVEKTWRQAVTLRWQPRYDRVLTLDAGLNRVSNRYHRSAEAEWIPSMLVTAVLRLE